MSYIVQGGCHARSTTLNPNLAKDGDFLGSSPMRDPRRAECGPDIVQISFKIKLFELLITQKFYLIGVLRACAFERRSASCIKVCVYLHWENRSYDHTIIMARSLNDQMSI